MAHSEGFLVLTQPPTVSPIAAAAMQPRPGITLSQREASAMGGWASEREVSNINVLLCTSNRAGSLISALSLLPSLFSHRGSSAEGRRMPTATGNTTVAKTIAMG